MQGVQKSPKNSKIMLLLMLDRIQDKWAWNGQMSLKLWL